MRTAATILFICFLILTNGCTTPAPNQATPQPSAETAASPGTNGPIVLSAAPNPNATPSPGAAGAKAKLDACSLLTSDEIKAVQGEAVKETTPSNHGSGDFIVSQCYYGLPTSSNSISLTLTERNPDSKGGEGVRDFWEQTFGKDERKSESERKKERDQEKKKPGAKREGEEEESAPLEPVRGVGDEAFWTASRLGGAVYVRTADRFIRISVGGKGDAEAKLKKSKTLAQNALRRM